MQQGEVLWYQWWYNYNGGDEDDKHGDDHNVDDINDYIIGNDHDRDDFNNDIYGDDDNGNDEDDDNDKCHYSSWEKNIFFELTETSHYLILFCTIPFIFIYVNVYI